MNFRRLSDSDELSPFEMNQLLDVVEQLASTPPALDGTIGLGDGGQVLNLFPEEIVAQITSGDGSLYGWVQCYPAALNADGSKGFTGPAPSGQNDPSIPFGTGQSGPAYEIKGRIDVPTGTRVFLRRSRRGPFYEFHYDGPGVVYSQAPYGTGDIPPRFGSVDWTDDRDTKIVGCTFSKVTQKHTLSIDGNGRLVIVDTLTPVSYTIGPFSLHGTVDVVIPSQTGSISGTAGTCPISGTVTVPGQTVSADLTGGTACP